MTTGTVQDAITIANTAFMEIFSHGDASGVADLYTAEGQIIPPNSDTISGHDGIQAFWQGAMDMGIKSAHLSTVELDECGGETAVETGTYELGDGTNVMDHGKYLVVWKLDGGTWKLHRDIWNTSAPAA